MATRIMLAAVLWISVCSEALTIRSDQGIVSFESYHSAPIAVGNGAHKLATVPEQQEALYMAYPLAIATVMLIVTVLYWPRGWQTILSVLIYILALSTMRLTVKYIFTVYGFNYPKFVTVWHFFMGAVTAFAICARRSWKGDKRMTIPTLSEFFFMIVPISLGFALSIAASNTALVFSSTAFAEIIGSTTPIFAIMMLVVMGKEFDYWLLVPVSLVVLGCVATTVGEVHFSTLGLVLCFAGNFFRSLKATLQQILMTGESKERYDPCTLLGWMCLPSMLVMLVWSLATEGISPIENLYSGKVHRVGLLAWIVISSVNATVLNLANLFVTKDLGAVGVQLTAQSKTILTVLGAVVMFHDEITKIEFVGFAIVLAGVGLYSRWEGWEKRALEQKLVPKPPWPILDQRIRKPA